MKMQDIFLICWMWDKGPKCCAVGYNAEQDPWSPYSDDACVIESVELLWV